MFCVCAALYVINERYSDVSVLCNGAPITATMCADIRRNHHRCVVRDRHSISRRRRGRGGTEGSCRACRPAAVANCSSCRRYVHQSNRREFVLGQLVPKFSQPVNQIWSTRLWTFTFGCFLPQKHFRCTVLYSYLNPTFSTNLPPFTMHRILTGLLLRTPRSSPFFSFFLLL